MSVLSPLPVRLAVYAALVLIALASIWFIDRRAMEIQRRHGWPYAQPQAAPLPQP